MFNLTNNLETYFHSLEVLSQLKIGVKVFYDSATGEFSVSEAKKLSDSLGSEYFSSMVQGGVRIFYGENYKTTVHAFKDFTRRLKEINLADDGSTLSISQLIIIQDFSKDILNKIGSKELAQGLNNLGITYNSSPEEAKEEVSTSISNFKKQFEDIKLKLLSLENKTVPLIKGKIDTAGLLDEGFLGHVFLEVGEYKPKNEFTGFETVVTKDFNIIHKVIDNTGFDLVLGKFNNDKNKCWMHACTQVLLALKDFLSQGIDKHKDWAVPKAFRQIINAIKTDNLKEIDAASRALHNALADPGRVNKNDEMCENIFAQHDAAAFFITVLADLGYSFQLQFKNQGVGDQSQLISLYPPSPECLVQLHFADGKGSLQEIVDHQFSPIKINDPANTWKYDNGDESYTEVSERTNQVSILMDDRNSPPVVLFVQLVRFVKDEVEVDLSGLKDLDLTESELAQIAAEQNSMKKIEKCLEFPLNDKQEYCIDFSKAFYPQSGEHPPVEYELLGVVHHHGELENGHYTANVLFHNPEKEIKQWVRCDDNGRRLESISPEKVSPGQGYILAFRLKNQ